jgi:hypothetical protein
LLESLSVIVTVDVDTPSAVTGPEPVMVECIATADPEMKTTDPSVFEIGVAMVSALVSALLEAKVQVDTPDAFVTEHDPYALVDPVFVAENVGVWPETLLLFESFKVMVTIDVAIPSATTGLVPVMFELMATAGPAVKMTEPSVFETGVRIERDLVSAESDVNVQVATPDPSVTEHAA